MVRLCRSLGTGHAIKIEIHLYTLPIHAASTMEVRIHIHPYTSTHIFCFYSGSMNPHISHSDPPRKWFYSYIGSELQKYYYNPFYPLLANKAPNI
jgi:hypothetical protein